MDIGIIEHGGDYSQIFVDIVSESLAEANFKKKKARDLFDVLAFARQMTGLDHLVIIAQLDEKNADMNNAFYEGLATLEADTGKPMLKALYFEDEGPEQIMKSLAKEFLNTLFPGKFEEKEPEEGMPEMPGI